MTDCSNAEIRDLLPDYVHDQLSVTDLARVEQHLVSCAECTDELALLQTVLAIRPEVGVPNVADIVASLPRPGQLTPVAADDRAPIAVDGVRDIASAKSVVRRTVAFRNWRSAAAVAVMAVGLLSIKVVRDNIAGDDITPLADSALVANLQSRSVQGGDANRLRDSAAGANVSRVSLSVGDPSDYSDDELEAMMARLDKWDGSASSEPLPGVPILPPGS